MTLVLVDVSPSVFQIMCNITKPRGKDSAVHLILSPLSVLWSLKLASEVFPNFFASDFSGEELVAAKQNSRTSAVAFQKELGMAEG